MAALFVFRGGTLDSQYVLRLQAFLALDNGKFYTLAFIQITKAVIVDNRGVMYEYVIAGLALDEAEALAFVKPLYLAGDFRHGSFLFYK